jgi:hypothetical protein
VWIGEEVPAVRIGQSPKTLVFLVNEQASARLGQKVYPSQRGVGQQREGITTGRSLRGIFFLQALDRDQGTDYRQILRASTAKDPVAIEKKAGSQAKESPSPDPQGDRLVAKARGQGLFEIIQGRGLHPLALGCAILDRVNKHPLIAPLDASTTRAQP